MAFGRQARSDYQTFVLLAGLGGAVDVCQKLHYLQMAAEKISKAYLASEEAPPPRVHNTFLGFVRREARFNTAIMAECGFRSKQRYGEYLRGLEPMAGELDALAPAVDPPPHNPEYPWWSPSGPLAPVDFSFPNTPLNTPATNKLLRFLEACLARL
jgi:hypothetical protein